MLKSCTGILLSSSTTSNCELCFLLLKTWKLGKSGTNLEESKTVENTVSTLHTRTNVTPIFLRFYKINKKYVHICIVVLLALASYDGQVSVL